MLQKIKKILTINKFTIAVAESLTAGHLQTLLSSISGASDFFEGGITSYSLNQKVNLLQIDKEEAKKTNCISQKIAEDMALNVAKKFNTDIGIGTTGYAESSENTPTPFAYYAITFQGKIVNEGKIKIPDLSRTKTQKKVAEYAIQQLNNFLKTI